MHFDPEAPITSESPTFGLHASPEQAAVVLLPVPFDATASYGRRTASGPETIRVASHQLDLFCRHTGKPYERGIATLPASADITRWNNEARALVDLARAGDEKATSAVNACSEKMRAQVYATAEDFITQGKIFGVIGGDHSVPLGSIQAHAEHYPNLSILHIDAHADLRNAYEGFAQSHASIMHNVMTHTMVKKIVQVGIRDFCESEYQAIIQSEGRIVTFFDDMLGDMSHWHDVVSELSASVYVSFDIDGLDPALCPHTGTPVPGGLSFRAARMLLRAITQSGRRIVGFDLCEVAPGDNADEWDGNVGARILYALCGEALLMA